jgi:IMP dehydrogenase
VPTRPGEVEERIRELVSAGVDFLCVDSSHGNSLHEKQLLEHIKGEYPKIDVIFGNVAEARGALAVREHCRQHGIQPAIPVISDGGYGTFSAIGKGLLFADCIMLGSMLAGTDEAPGEVVYDRQGRKLKTYKGMGSLESARKGSSSRYDVNDFEAFVAEGVVGSVRAKGPVSRWVPQIKTGIRKCLQSLGFRNLESLHEAVFGGEVQMERMSEAGKKEAGIHDLVEYTRDLPLD